MAILDDLGADAVEEIVEDIAAVETVEQVDTVLSQGRPVYLRVVIDDDSPGDVNHVRRRHGLRYGVPRIDAEGRLVVSLGVRDPDDGPPEALYVAEAYADGERIERVIHTNEADAWHDIEVLTAEADPETIEVSECRLYTGADAREVRA